MIKTCISDTQKITMAVDLPYNQSLLYLCMDGGDDDAIANALGRNVGKDLLEVLTDYLQDQEC